MNMFLQFEPQHMIEGIEIAQTTEHRLNADELSYLKSKLIEAETNQHIIRLARGDGRTQVIDDIIANDGVIFDWGLKSQHAFHEQSRFRDFLEPNSLDVDMMKEIIAMFENALSYRYNKHFINQRNWLSAANNIVQDLNDIIDSNRHTRENLLLIKDWICATLQTAGSADFKNISPWVSTTTGADRYKTAYCFGQRCIPFSRRTMGANKRFVIFDTWVSIQDEHCGYERTQYLIQKFKKLGLTWYPDKHHEIMLKYAIYPQNLVGYYYFEQDNLLHYQVNPHYWDEIKDNPDFKIGDPLYFDQPNVNFPANNPYRIIYSRAGNRFETYSRR